MKDNAYKSAMEKLPVSKNLEEKTMALLTSSHMAKKREERKMKTKWVKMIGSLAAACLVLAIVVPALVPGERTADTGIVGVEAQFSETVARKSLGMVAPGEVQYEAEADAMFYAAAPLAGHVEWNTEEFNYISENRFLSARLSPLSTFAADADTASYAKLRSAILRGDIPPVDSVRIEEMLNYFVYDYKKPEKGEPFGVTTEIADCPWNADTKLLLIGLQAEKIETDNLPAQNLVFLIDVSGSMDSPDKLPLAVRAFKLVLEELKPTDTVAIVTYASGDRVVLDGVRASDKVRIMEALDSLMAGGGTAGAAGINTAYDIAQKHLIKGGNNRVILATDGDLNIGVSSEGDLTRLVEEKREGGVFLSVLGFGSGNYKDNKLEALADHGNGNYAYIDTIFEARKALVEELGATFFTVAKDVKLQVEFNPAKIKGYRLIGYENRLLNAEDFKDDTKDGGEIGSGHRMTALYEIVPIDSQMAIDEIETKYQTTAGTDSAEWLTVNLRCKAPDGDTSTLYSYPVDETAYVAEMSDNMRFASAVAETGMLLRDSEFKGTASYAEVLERLRGTKSVTGDVYKEEFQYLVTKLGREK